MKFEEQNRFSILSKKYNFDKHTLINWFINKKEKEGIPLEHFSIDIRGGCMMQSTSDGYLCKIMIQRYNTCERCVFNQKHGDYNDSIDILKNIIRIIKK